MARRVFFSFHFERDIWRVNQVRNSNVVNGVDHAGFYDHSEYAEAKTKSDAVIERMIKAKLDGTSVTVVLIGQETATRPWVRRELELSLAQRNGFVGIRIHHLKNKDKATCLRGPEPVIPGVKFPLFSWDGDLNWFAGEIEAAGQRADAWRKKL